MNSFALTRNNSEIRKKITNTRILGFKKKKTINVNKLSHI